MKTLSEQYHGLEIKVTETYNKLIENKNYDILKAVILRDYDSIANQILAEIEEEEINVVAQEYDFLEGCEQVYYNTRRGTERMAYLLGASKDGVFIFDDRDWDTTFINFSDLNGLHVKISVVEEIETLAKN